MDLIVLDLGSRDRDVVLVRRTISSGKPRGVGNLEWGGNGEVSLRATWGQGGQEHITPKEGFQVSKAEWKRESTGNWQGKQKKGYCAINILPTCVYV